MVTFLWCFFFTAVVASAGKMWWIFLIIALILLLLILLLCCCICVQRNRGDAYPGKDSFKNFIDLFIFIPDK